MEEWKEYKLEEICTKITDGSHSSPKAQESGYPMFSVKDMLEYGFDYSKCKYISQEDYVILKHNGCVPQKGDVLVAKDGSYLKQIFVCKETKEEAILSSIAIFRPNSLVESYFLNYLLKSPQVYNYIANNCVSGSALPRIVLKDFKAVKLPIPSIEIQKSIDAILKSLDDKIEVNRRINDNLEQQAQALFKSWFVDFEPFKDQPFVESELGMIPQGWKVISLGDVCSKITDGSHYSPKDDSCGKIPMLSVKDMRHNGFDYSSCKNISEEEYEKMKTNDCVPLKKDILVAKDGSYLKEIFLCMQEEKQAILSSIAIFRSNSNIIYPELLLQLLRLPSVRKDVGDNYVSGSALPRIVLKDFKKFRFVIAPIEVQSQIVDAIRSINSQIYIKDLETRRLAELRDTLLPRLMSGELKVNDLDQEL